MDQHDHRRGPGDHAGLRAQGGRDHGAAPPAPGQYLLTRSVWRIGRFSNRWILGGVALQAVGQAAFSYLPAMHTVFGTAPIDLQMWARIAILAALAGEVVALDKRLRRRLL